MYRHDVAAAAAVVLACDAGLRVFRCASVRELLLRDEESERFLQRKHVRVASAGFATAASMCGECDEEERAVPLSIYAKMAEGREEGGEIPQ